MLKKQRAEHANEEDQSNRVAQGDALTNRTQIGFLQNTLNRLFERALHAVLFTLMAAKAINAHQCFARRVRSTLWNSH